MAYRFTRFEKFLVSGMVVTGLGIATYYLVEMDRGSAVAAPNPPPAVAKDAPLRTWKNEVPEQGWDKFFLYLRIEGKTKSGETVRGRVDGTELSGEGVKVLDERSGQTRYYRLDEFESFEVLEYRNPYDTLYEIRVRMPGGKERVLIGRLVEEREDSFVFQLESGYVTIARGDVASIKPLEVPKK
ncbi:MAG: hypothetical protein HY720_19650 [Planctomycetes bacterium]|nr:hypothetical protein [Planctomycetota bacterium]